MSVEIERKFLVKNRAYRNLSFRSQKIAQGYLSSVPERTVRIRIKGEQGFMTIKGMSNKSGVSRFEWEKEIPLDEAKKLLDLCEPGVIEKTRYFVKEGRHTFEVDEFEGDNTGLVIAEIELDSEDEIFTKPDWLGEEVTGDEKYYNASLSRHPFKIWR